MDLFVALGSVFAGFAAVTRGENVVKTRFHRNTNTTRNRFSQFF